MPTPTTPARTPGVGSAQTRPDYFRALGTGLGVVPRRGWDVATNRWLLAAAQGTDGLRGFVQSAPCRVLQVLADTHPYFSLARSNDLALAFGPGDTRIVAETPGAAAETSAGQTDSVEGLWDRAEGGYAGLTAAAYDGLSTCGMVVIECVPGPRGTGVSQILTADPLTCRFIDRADGTRGLQQQQGGIWQDLDPRRVRAFAHGGTRDNPYGVPRWSAALTEGMRDFQRQGHLDDILYSVAWPRITAGFPLNETVKFAQENPQVLTGQATDAAGVARDQTPVEFAFAAFSQMQDSLTQKRHDDAFLYFKEGVIAILSGADGLAGLQGTLDDQRLRLITGLHQLTALMNIDLGGTLAFSSTQFKAYAKKLEALRALICGQVLCWVATCHLQWQGLALEARADYEPIQTSDALVDQQTRQIEMANDFQLFDNGLIDDATLADRLGVGAVSDPAKLAGRADRMAALAAPAPAPAKPPNPQTPVDNTDTKEAA
jgi:hypothetical protein